MPTHQLQRKGRQGYFDGVSRHPGGEQAEIETTGLDPGNRAIGNGRCCTV